LAFKTQSIDSVINLASILNNIDHWEKGMTLEKLGLKDTDSDMIGLYLENGNIAK
jgi:hypothetical protein